MQKNLFTRFYKWLLSCVDAEGSFYFSKIFLLCVWAEIPILLAATVFVPLDDLWIIYLLKFVIGYGLCFLLLGFARKFLQNPVWRYGSLAAFSEIYMLALMWGNIPETMRESASLGDKIELFFGLIYSTHTSFFGFWCWLFPFFVAWGLAAYAEIEVATQRNPIKDSDLLDD